MRILLIDDDVGFCEELSHRLAHQGIEVVSVGDGHGGAGLVEELAPDVILLDMSLSSLDDQGVLGAVRQRHTAIPVVVITASQDDDDLAVALRGGAQGYLLKDIEADQLVTALRQILNGDTVVAPQLTGALARIVSHALPLPTPPAPIAPLTPRECQILQHLAAGSSNKAIARALAITDGTVKLHVKSILRKLHVSSRVEAAVMAVARGRTRDMPSSPTPPAPIAPLTPRECQILQHLAAGSSNKAIARALAITDGTVKLHVKS
ncbi:MAG: LuxR C-terminal-related transcriptional regulator, partial [Acidiferrobacter sp.]